MFKNCLSIKRKEFISVTLEELVLHLDPMESETMQEAFHLIHAHDNCKCNRPEDWEQDETEDKSKWNCRTTNGGSNQPTSVDTEIVLDDQVEEHFGKLSVSKRESPKSEIRSGVGDGSKNKLNGLNQLTDN